MQRAEFDYIFFDLDGTLTDPAEGITNSFAYALKSLGREVPPYQTLCSFIGPPLAVTFGELLNFPQSQIDECIKKYREYFAETGLFENKVYPEIESLLISLKSAGKKLFVATSKPEHFSVRILERFKLLKYFERVCGSLMDESRSKKSEVIEYTLECAKNPPKESVLMIGDRFYDIEGAHQNGIKACGVLFGYGKRPEFEAANADFIVESVSDLQKMLLEK